MIKGQPTSAEVRARLKAENRPVCLACSLGKDSLAAWCALEADGIDVVPVYFWSVPDLPLVQENLDRIGSIFGVRIHSYPHPRFFRTLANHVFQPPHRLSVLESTKITGLDYEQLWPMIKQDLELPEDTWVCDGVRACDSIQRRASLTRHGVMKLGNRKASVIADWTKNEVMDAIRERGIGLPPDYELFGRSFDGLDKRFTESLREARPGDFAVVEEWYPAVSLDIKRWEHYGL